MWSLPKPAEAFLGKIFMLKFSYILSSLNKRVVPVY